MLIEVSVIDMDIFKDVVNLLKNTLDMAQEPETKKYINNEIDRILDKYSDIYVEQILRP